MSIVCYDSEGAVLETLYQYDVNQTISITGIDTAHVSELHFSNYRHKDAYIIKPTISGNKITGDIPNALLAEGEVLLIYVYTTVPDIGGRTKYVIRIPVIPRAKPTNYIDMTAPEAVSELLDIRRGWDGTMYPTAGDAVRALGGQGGGGGDNGGVFLVTLDNNSVPDKTFAETQQAYLSGKFVFMKFPTMADTIATLVFFAEDEVMLFGVQFNPALLQIVTFTPDNKAVYGEEQLATSNLINDSGFINNIDLETALFQKINKPSNTGAVGDFAVNDGTGGIIWKTIPMAEGGTF